MRSRWKFSKVERALIAVALIGICFCLYLLSFDQHQIQEKDPALAIGSVKTTERDTRQKQKGSFVWDQLKERQGVYVGDSVYTGSGARVHIDLQSGSSVQIAEHSLVTFDLMEKEKVMDLEMGNFRVKVDGKLTVAIQGQLTTLEGNSSDLQVFIGKNKKPKLKVLSGQISVKRDQKTVHLKSPKVAKKKPTLDPKTKTASSSEPEPSRSITSTSDSEGDQILEPESGELAIEQFTEPEEIELPTSQTLLDETPVAKSPALNPFEKTEMDASASKTAPAAEPTPTPVAKADETYFWKLYDLYDIKELELIAKKRDPTLLERTTLISWKSQKLHSIHVQWSKDAKFITAKNFLSATGALALDEIAIGQNYWRISNDGFRWSDTQSFRFEPKYLPKSEPTVEKVQTQISWQGSPIHLEIPLKTRVRPIGFIAQASLNSKFTTEETKTFWSAKPEVRVSFYRPGTYHYRFKMVNSAQELSEWSKPVRFVVEVPPPPPPAPIPQRTLDLRLTKKEKPEKVEIVRAPPKGASEISKELEKMELRKPSAVEASSLKLDLKTTPPTNEKYKSSRLSVQGFLWTLQSSEQKLAEKEAPITTGVGVHGIYWKNQHGLEGSAKSGATGVNTTGQEATSLKAFEGRYHYRIYTGFPFGLSRELQTSVFAGYETYRSKGSYFSNEYDLMKFGTSLEFPWSKRFSSGGEFVYGNGLDQSKKYEISGKFNYFLTQDWSVGAGYRVHMFEAGSKAASPQGILPYREGYTEGFSVLNYHF